MSKTVAGQPDSDDTTAGRSWLLRYGVALMAVLVAFVMRWSVDKEFGNKHVFVTFIVATIAATWYGGLGPSLVVAVLGELLGCYYFLDPRHSFLVNNFADAVLPPMLVQLCIITFGYAMHAARQRADANAQKAIRHQKQLEAEVVERKRVEDEVRRLNGELEQRVAQRTAELVAINQ